MSDFLRFQMAQETTRARLAEYGGAQSRLGLAQTYEREAELVSQSFGSLKLATDLGTITERERAIGIAFARYAVFGRTDNKGFLATHGKQAEYCSGPAGSVGCCGAPTGPVGPTGIPGPVGHRDEPGPAGPKHPVDTLDWHPENLEYYVEAQ